MVNSNIWVENCRLCREVKHVVRKKKLAVWKEIMEKVNADFDGSRKEFGALVGRKTDGNIGMKLIN